jgi:shikimate dehydrogenase
MQLPTGASRFVFIFAHPAGHVGAPRHYTPYFHDNGLDWHMVPLDIAPEHLADTIRTLAKSPSVAGFNLTMPHKPAAFELCDAVGPAAQFEGVVNTIRIERGGRLVGESFDGGGFLNAAREAGVFNPERRCVVIGAGGAGRAICHALAAAGLKRLRILNEAPRPVETLAPASSNRSSRPTSRPPHPFHRASSSTQPRSGCTQRTFCRWIRRSCQPIAPSSISSPHGGPNSCRLAPRAASRWSMASR